MVVFFRGPLVTGPVTSNEAALVHYTTDVAAYIRAPTRVHRLHKMVMR